MKKLLLQDIGLGKYKNRLLLKPVLREYNSLSNILLKNDDDLSHFLNTVTNKFYCKYPVVLIIENDNIQIVFNRTIHIMKTSKAIDGNDTEYIKNLINCMVNEVKMDGLCVLQLVDIEEKIYRIITDKNYDFVYENSMLVNH